MAKVLCYLGQVNFKKQYQFLQRINDFESIAKLILHHIQLCGK